MKFIELETIILTKMEQCAFALTSQYLHVNATFSDKEVLYHFTSKKSYQRHIDLEALDYKTIYAVYSDLSISSSSDFFWLNVSGYSGKRYCV